MSELQIVNGQPRQYLPIQAFSQEFELHIRMPSLLGLVPMERVDLRQFRVIEADDPQPMDGVEFVVPCPAEETTHSVQFPGDFSTNIGIVAFTYNDE